MANFDSVIDAIAKEVTKGQCILILGAGVHYPPPPGSPYEYPKDDRPPLGPALSLHLAEKCKLAESNPKEANNINNLQRVSLFFEKDTSRNRLVQEVKDAVGGNKKPSPAVSALAQ